MVFRNEKTMSILNPCCCITLRTGAKIVSTIDVLVAFILLIIFLSDLAVTISNNGNVQAQPLQSLQADEEDDDESCEADLDYSYQSNLNKRLEGISNSYVTTGSWTILTVFLATNVGISILLYTGARNFSIRRCKWWFYIQTVITAVAVAVLVLIICFKVSFALIVLDLVHLIYRLYTLWVVYLFIGELTYLDTLYSLSSSKKGGGNTAPGGGFMYPSSLYTTNGSVISSTQSYQHFAPYSHNMNPYYLESTGINDGIHHSGHEVPNNTSTTHINNHYNSSDDGLPPVNGGGLPLGGIDNPSYIH